MKIILLNLILSLSLIAPFSQAADYESHSGQSTLVPHATHKMKKQKRHHKRTGLNADHSRTTESPGVGGMGMAGGAGSAVRRGSTSDYTPR